MELTTNYKMRKPGRGAAADPADITDLNYNADILDRVVKETAEAVSSHAGDRANPHGVTKADVGLADADNTPDAEKPLSAPQKAYIDAVAQEGFGAASIPNAMLEQMPALTVKGNDADLPAVPRDLTMADLATLLGSDVARVVEQGSNENGSYIKYADGRMECAVYKAFTNVAATSASASGGYHYQTPIIALPQMFAARPTDVQASVITSTSTPFAVVRTVSAADMTLFLTRVTSGNITAEVCVTLKGRWK